MGYWESISTVACIYNTFPDERALHQFEKGNVRVVENYWAHSVMPNLAKTHEKI